MFKLKPTKDTPNKYEERWTEEKSLEGGFDSQHIYSRGMTAEGAPIPRSRTIAKGSSLNAVKGE